jgi:hypothetical protein
MKKNKELQILKSDVRHTKINTSDEDLSGVIFELYRDKIIQLERENKVILDEIKLATKGKEIIFEQCSMNSF